MSKAERKAARAAAIAAGVDKMLAPAPEATQVAGMNEAQAAVADAPKPEAPKQEVDQMLVLGAKAPKHRVGHTGAAWAVIVPKLPAKASDLAKLPELCVPQCGGPKGNGMLYVSYAIRRGWLAKQA